MYRKAHMSGGCGGLVYTRNIDLFHQALAHADRGKPRWLDAFDDRDPRSFLFPALNLHTDEISCAIGHASLARLPETIMRRLAFVSELTGRLNDKSRICTPYGYSPNDSPFIEPIMVDTLRLWCTKIEFANALRAEGIALNPHYEYLVCDWPWMKKYIDCDTPNARDARDRSFVLYLNENYGTHEVQRIIRAIERVERAYMRGSA
jgi:dTDP-4-amino-4,6-dideoxygalactose transaminase